MKDIKVQTTILDSIHKLKGKVYKEGSDGICMVNHMVFVRHNLQMDTLRIVLDYHHLPAMAESQQPHIFAFLKTIIGFIAKLDLLN